MFKPLRYAALPIALSIAIPTASAQDYDEQGTQESVDTPLSEAAPNDAPSQL